MRRKLPPAPYVSGVVPYVAQAQLCLMFYLPETNLIRKQNWRKVAVAGFKILLKHCCRMTEKTVLKMPVRVAAFKDPESNVAVGA